MDEHWCYLHLSGTDPMRMLSAIAFLVLLLQAGAPDLESADRSGQAEGFAPIETKIDHFDVEDAIMRDGISALSLKNIPGLHLGFEEIIRDKIQDDPRSVNIHFSLHLQNKTVREILSTLCEADRRYIWSQDANTMNVYPAAAEKDASYLLSLYIERISVVEIPDPDQGLTPLSKIFPNHQVGYMGGGEESYAEPWTAAFDHLTVRQFINRLAYHMDPQTTWIWQGGKEERMFTFFKGGFHAF